MDELWSNNDYRYYLAHHGILGQKWGQKNGPPYPLDAGDHSASEKKAGWKKSLGGVFKKKNKPQMSLKDLELERKIDLEDANNGRGSKEQSEILRKFADDKYKAGKEYYDSVSGGTPHKEAWAEYKSKMDKLESDKNSALDKLKKEDSRLERYKADVKRANEASTDEEHDRLNRIADTRNSLESRSYKSAYGESSWYELSNKNANYRMDDNDDSTIEALHKIDDDFKSINSACRDAVSKEIQSFNKQMKQDGEPRLNQTISFDKPSIRVIPDYDEAIVTIRADGTVPGYYDVEYDYKTKKVHGTSFND